MATRRLSYLQSAVEADAWEYLSINAPVFADALAAEVERGATPAEIKGFLAQALGPGREALVRRCEQAAHYLIATTNPEKNTQ